MKMINPRFTRGEYWLLETVAEAATPICWLDSENLEEVLNKKGHGMSRSLLVDTMHKLFLDGLIIAHRGGEWNDSCIIGPDQIEAALDERYPLEEIQERYYYGLTEKGGEYFEAFASPNWSFYIDCSFEMPEDDKEYIWAGEIICMTKTHLENYFKSLSFYQYDIDTKTVQWDLLEPWKATYWKELPTGHQVRFRCKDKELIDPALPRPIDQTWYDKLWYQWQ
jgi:hypothetical protein